MCWVRHQQWFMVVSGAIIERCYGCCYVGFSTSIDHVVGGSPGGWIALTFFHNVIGAKGLDVRVCGRGGKVVIDGSNCHGEVGRCWNFHVKTCRSVYYIA